MFTLKILTDLSMMPKVVETNIDDVKPAIDAAIAKLDGLVVTDKKEDIISADADAAKLRKMSEAIKRFRLDHIAIWKEPMEAFETKCKAAEKRLTEAATTITTKTGEVKEMWRQRKRDKYAALWQEKLSGIFSDETKNCEHVRNFFAHWTDPKTKGTWVNSSVSDKTVTDAMDAEIKRMSDCFDALEANYSGQSEEIQAKARYALLKRFDLNDVINEVNRWKAEQKAIAEAAEAERKRKSDKEAAMEQAKRELAAHREKMVKAEAARKEEEALAQIAPTATTAPKAGTLNGDEAKKETYRLEITGTRVALTKLRQYGLELGIEFRNLDK